LLAATGASAQFAINWYKVSSGGGTSANAVYSVSGTIGQHDAGGPMTNGQYSLSGGFWFALQTPGAPDLSINLTSSNSVLVFWPSPSTGFNLQQNNDLNTSTWATPVETVNDNGVIKYIIVTSPAATRFYRLEK
jgi:hypothetical protein